MLNVAAASINTFGTTSPKADFVPPSEQLITLTYGQLQVLIQKAVEKAVAPLQERLDRLEALQEVYHGPAPQVDEIPMYRDAWEKNRETMQNLPVRVWALEQDLSELEKTATKPKGEPTQKTLDHLTEIATILGAKEKRLREGPQESSIYLARFKREGMTFSELSVVMDLTVDRIRQLSRLAATDQRFNIGWHPRRKNTKIIKLRRWDVQ
jgi:hypothetical protein